jgi:peptidoglycan hydrolase-like protein with peptidoglycan-binding domain
MTIPIGQIIGLALRIVSNRDKIAGLWDQITALVQEVRGNDPQLGNLFDQLIHPAKPAPQTMDVKWLQESLNTLGYGPLTVDGDYGEATKAAVRKFQQAHSLEVDGWAGVSTQAAILEELSKKG